MRRWVVVLLASLALAGCGRKATPSSPPDAFYPHEYPEMAFPRGPEAPDDLDLGPKAAKDGTDAAKTAPAAGDEDETPGMMVRGRPLLEPRSPNDVGLQR